MYHNPVEQSFWGTKTKLCISKVEPLWFVAACTTRLIIAMGEAAHQKPVAPGLNERPWAPHAASMHMKLPGKGNASPVSRNEAAASATATVAGAKKQHEDPYRTLSGEQRAAVRMIVKTLKYHVLLKTVRPPQTYTLDDIVNDYLQPEDKQIWLEKGFGAHADAAMQALSKNGFATHLNIIVGVPPFPSKIGLSESGLADPAKESQYNDMLKNPMFPKIYRVFHDTWELSPTPADTCSVKLEKLVQVIDPEQNWGWSEEVTAGFLRQWSDVFTMEIRESDEDFVTVQSWDKLQAQYKAYMNARSKKLPRTSSASRSWPMQANCNASMTAVAERPGKKPRLV